MNNTERETISVPELARLLGVGKSTLFAAVAAGHAPFRVIRVGRRIVVPRAEVDRLLAGQE